MSGRLMTVMMPVLVAVFGVVLTATQASAATGTGSYTGTATFTNTLTSPPPNVCFHTTASLTTSAPGDNASGNFADSTNSYGGALTVTYDYSYYQNAYHTYTDPSCTTPGPGPVTDASITGGSGSDSVSCTWTSGTFERSTDPNTNQTTETVDLPAASGSCSIDGDPATPTHVVATGAFGTCIPATAPPPPSSCKEHYSFTATNS